MAPAISSFLGALQMTSPTPVRWLTGHEVATFVTFQALADFIAVSIRLSHSTLRFPLSYYIPLGTYTSATPR